MTRRFRRPQDPFDRRDAMAALLAGSVGAAFATAPRLAAAAATPSAAARSATQASGTLPTGASRPQGSLAAGDRWASSFLLLDPVQRFRQALRIQRSLADEADILHWYHFIMVAVPLNATPKAVVRWEGIEFSRHQKLAENRYRLHGHNLSFPRHLETGEFVDAVLNPVTKKRVTVPPMALTADPGMCARPPA